MAFAGLGKLTLVLQAVDKASPAIQKVKRETAGLGTQVKKSGLDTLVLGGALTAVGAAGIYAANKFAQSAADLEALRRGFNQLTRDSSLSFEALQKAAGGTVSQIDLLRSANQALMLGIDPEALPEMMEIARKSAVAMGVEVTFAFDSMARGIGRQSKLILDNIGIVFSADEAYREYAETLGKNVSELTDAEKKQAYLNKALKVGREHVAKLGDITGGAAEAYQKFSAAMKDFQATMGATVLPVITNLLGALKGVLDFFKALPRPVRTFIGVSGLLVSALAVVTGAYIALSAAITKAATAMGILQALSGPVGWAILAGATAAAVATTLWIESMTKMEDAASKAAEGIQDDFGELEKSITDKIEELSDTSVEALTSGLLDKAQSVVEKFTQCTGEKGHILSEDYQQSMEELVTNTNELIKAGLWGQAQKNMAAFAECSVSKQADMVDQIEEYLDQLYEQYKDNTNKIAVYTKAGMEEQARIYEEENQLILQKIQQFQEWKKQIIETTEEDITAYLEQVKEERLKQAEELTRYLNELQRLQQEARFLERERAPQEAPPPTHPTVPKYIPPMGVVPTPPATSEKAYELRRYFHVPGYQHGGIVAQPTLALLGEKGPELVVPLKRLREPAMVARGAGGLAQPLRHFTSNVTVHVHGDIRTEADEERLARKIAEIQLNEMKAAWR